MAGTPVAGKDYEVLKAPQPVSAPPGKVEVIAFFWYGDPRSAELEPLVDSWSRQHTTAVLKRIPVAFRDDFVPHAKMFYALSALGLLDALHLKVYPAIHREKNNLLTPQAQADWLAGQGVDKKKYLDAYNSFSVQAQTKQAAELLKSYNIDGVPTLVVRGKYKTGPAYTNSLEGTTAVLDHLVEQTAAGRL
ncbi:thiol:disulfide interchange protein DsbA/DsbL [Streptomyces violascens]|uniref:thiol:disulfide interchange protein DsbA/DsbL n=1 Tax=Streptomyces violascens TaxID=67381 RepID=UPI00365E9EC4